MAWSQSGPKCVAFLHFGLVGSCSTFPHALTAPFRAAFAAAVILLTQQPLLSYAHADAAA